MNLDTETIGILRCPVCCRGDIEIAADALLQSQSLACRHCGQIVPAMNGVADFLLEKLLPRSDEKVIRWRSKLKLQELWWNRERESGRARLAPSRSWRPSKEVIERYFRLGEVVGARGRLLDVGCAEGQRRAHFARNVYHGIDPLVLKHTFDFPFFRGLAEFLPFKDAIFDVVLSVESIDHFLNPERALDEMLRVLRVQGALFVFVGDARCEAMRDTLEANEDQAGSISEEDVHLHRLSEEFFTTALSRKFDEVEIKRSGKYLALFAWGRQ